MRPHIAVGLHVKMGTVQQDQFLHAVLAIIFLQLGGHLEANASTVGVANQSVRTLRLHLLHLLDVRAGHIFDAVIGHTPSELETVDGEIALRSDQVDWGGDAFDGMHLNE